MKKTLILILFALPLIAMGQYDRKYLKGAVPVENGYIVFRDHYDCSGQTKEGLRQKLLNYVTESLVNGENALSQSRITDAGDSTGYIAASIEETLYFQRSAFATHSTLFYYQLIITPQDGGFDIEMRRLRYLYEEALNAGYKDANFPAEEWITDEEALNKKGQLTRIGGKKFRRFTIDRKDEVFKGAARAAGADKRIVIIEEEY